MSSISTYLWTWVLRLWEKYSKISGKKRKSYSIRPKVDLYEVCASLLQILYYYYYYFYTNTSFTSARLVASLTLGERILGNIGQYASSQRKTRGKMIDGGPGCR